ncbi:MAG TPA: DUF2203 domain-containing protein [Actinomycetota bacterium]
MTRRYSLDEARAALPEIRDRVERIRRARRALLDASERLEEAVARDGGGVAGTDSLRARADLRAEVEWFAARGIVLRDPGQGLVDFPSDLDGREVFLCWRTGEDDIAWYHELEAGFAGRRPL